MSAAASHLVVDVLSDNNARVPTFGPDSVLRTRGFAAVKTGTSKDMRDNWCIGFSDRYTVGVWIGNASGAPMHAVSGISGAAPIWQALLQALHSDRPAQPPRPPAGLVQARVEYAGGEEAPRREWFIAGTEPQQPIAARTKDLRLGITQPRDGTVFALDPDMPAAVQRIRIEGQRGRWLLDGRLLGEGERLHWSPWPGRHELRLLTPDGHELERVHFEVRGAGVAGARRAGR
jgi:penicillin-binding protein 1C